MWRENQRLRVFENRVLRKILGLKKGKTNRAGKTA
jgi:hypothetical protein